MRKLFTLAAAVLASFSLWAVDPSYQSSEWATQADAEAALGKHGNVTLAQSGLSYGNLGSNGSFYYVAVSQNLKSSDSDWKYFSIVADENYFIDSVSVWYCENGSNETNVAWIGWGEGETPATKSLAHGETAGTKGSKKLADAKWVTIDAHTYDIQTMYISRSIREFQDAEEKKISNFGKGQTLNILGFKIWLRKGCTDPEFTVPEGGTGFVGDPIDLAITSKNNSKPVNYAVTVDGVEGVNGTDYSFNVSPGLVQATPLRAGTFVVTFSQASDGTYCDAEESATFEISAKNPVTSFEVVGPTKAHIGEEVTLTATNFDAAPTEISWLQVNIYEIVGDKESYTFTSNAEGTIEFYALARNKFNNPDDQADDYQVAVYHAVTFALGTDATLSDLKVNGATIDGFAADKYEYNVELGVYEALNVEATAADAPYASAAVVDNGEGKVTITVTAQDESTKEYVINYTRAAKTELASISESTTWDWANAGSVTPEFKDNTLPTKSEEFNFADVLINPAESFNAAALVGIAQFANRSGSYFQGNMVKFNTTVKGTVEIFYQNTSNRDESGRRWVVVNSTKVGDGAIDQKAWYSASTNVAAGEVKITFVDVNEAETMLRINKIVFTKDEATALDNTETSVKAVKFFQNGQLFIEKNGKVYTIIGSEIR